MTVAGARRAKARLVTDMGIGSSDLLGGLFLVVWVDSHHRPGWTTAEAEAAPLKCISVGFLVNENANAITLSANVSVETEAQRCGDMTIPRCAILKMKRIL